MTSIEKLAERIKKDFDIEVDVKTFIRLYPGYWQRSSGAWSWCINEKGYSVNSIGSQWPVREILKAKELSTSLLMGDTSIIIESSPTQEKATTLNSEKR